MARYTGPDMGRLVSRRCVSEDRSASGEFHHPPKAQDSYSPCARASSAPCTARYHNVARSHSMLDTTRPLEWPEGAHWRATFENEALESNTASSENNVWQCKLVSSHRVHPGLRPFIPSHVRDEEVLNLPVIPQETTHGTGSPSCSIKSQIDAARRECAQQRLLNVKKTVQISSTINRPFRQEQTPQKRIDLTTTTPVECGSILPRTPEDIIRSLRPFIKKETNVKQVGLDSRWSPNLGRNRNNENNDIKVQEQQTNQIFPSVLFNCQEKKPVGNSNSTQHARSLELSPLDLNLSTPSQNNEDYDALDISGQNKFQSLPSDILKCQEQHSDVIRNLVEQISMLKSSPLDDVESKIPINVQKIEHSKCEVPGQQHTLQVSSIDLPKLESKKYCERTSDESPEQNKFQSLPSDILKSQEQHSDVIRNLVEQITMLKSSPLDEVEPINVQKIEHSKCEVPGQSTLQASSMDLSKQENKEYCERTNDETPGQNKFQRLHSDILECHKQHSDVIRNIVDQISLLRSSRLDELEPNISINAQKIEDSKCEVPGQQPTLQVSSMDHPKCENMKHCGKTSDAQQMSLLKSAALDLNYPNVLQSENEESKFDLPGQQPTLQVSLSELQKYEHKNNCGKSNDVKQTKLLKSPALHLKHNDEENKFDLPGQTHFSQLSTSDSSIREQYKENANTKHVQHTNSLQSSLLDMRCSKTEVEEHTTSIEGIPSVISNLQPKANIENSPITKIFSWLTLSKLDSVVPSKYENKDAKAFEMPGEETFLCLDSDNFESQETTEKGNAVKQMNSLESTPLEMMGSNISETCHIINNSKFIVPGKQTNSEQPESLQNVAGLDMKIIPNSVKLKHEENMFDIPGQETYSQKSASDLSICSQGADHATSKTVEQTNALKSSLLDSGHSPKSGKAQNKNNAKMVTQIQQTNSPISSLYISKDLPKINYGCINKDQQLRSTSASLLNSALNESLVEPKNTNSSKVDTEDRQKKCCGKINTIPYRTSKVKSKAVYPKGCKKLEKPITKIPDKVGLTTQHHNSKQPLVNLTKSQYAPCNNITPEQQSSSFKALLPEKSNSFRDMDQFPCTPEQSQKVTSYPPKSTINCSLQTPKSEKNLQMHLQKQLSYPETTENNMYSPQQVDYPQALSQRLATSSFKTDNASKNPDRPLDSYILIQEFADKTTRQPMNPALSLCTAHLEQTMDVNTTKIPKSHRLKIKEELSPNQVICSSENIDLAGFENFVEKAKSVTDSVKTHINAAVMPNLSISNLAEETPYGPIDMANSIANICLVGETKLYNLQWLTESTDKTCLGSRINLISDEDEEFHDCISWKDQHKSEDVSHRNEELQDCGTTFKSQNTQLDVDKNIALEMEKQYQNVKQSKSLPLVAETSWLPYLNNTLNKTKLPTAIEIIKTVSCPFLHVTDKTKNTTGKEKYSGNNGSLVTLWEKARVTNISAHKEAKFNVFKPSTWLTFFTKTDIPPVSERQCKVIQNVDLPSLDSHSYDTMQKHVIGPLHETYKQTIKEVGKIVSQTQISTIPQCMQFELKSGNILADNYRSIISHDWQEKETSTDLSESLEWFNSEQFGMHCESNLFNCNEALQTETGTNLKSSIIDEQNCTLTSKCSVLRLSNTQDTKDVLSGAPSIVAACSESNCHCRVCSPHARLQPNSSKFLEGVFHDNQQFKVQHKQNYSTTTRKVNESAGTHANQSTTNVGEKLGIEECSTPSTGEHSGIPVRKRQYHKQSDISESIPTGLDYTCQPSEFPPPIARRAYRVPMRIVYADRKTEVSRPVNAEAIALPPEKLPDLQNSPRLNTSSVNAISELQDRLKVWGQARDHTDRRLKRVVLAREMEKGSVLPSNKAGQYTQERHFSTNRRPFRLENIPNPPKRIPRRKNINIKPSRESNKPPKVKSNQLTSFDSDAKINKTEYIQTSDSIPCSQTLQCIQNKIVNKTNDQLKQRFTTSTSENVKKADTEGTNLRIATHRTEGENKCSHLERSKPLHLRKYVRNMNNDKRESTQTENNSNINNPLAIQRGESSNNELVKMPNSQFKFPKIEPADAKINPNTHLNIKSVESQLNHCKTQVNNLMPDPKEMKIAPPTQISLAADLRRVNTEKTPSDNVVKKSENSSLLEHNSLTRTTTTQVSKAKLTDAGTSVLTYTTNTVDGTSESERIKHSSSQSFQIISDLITNKKEVKKLTRNPSGSQLLPDEVEIDLPRKRAHSVIEMLSKKTTKAEPVHNLASKQAKCSAKIIKKLLTPVNSKSKANRITKQKEYDTKLWPQMVGAGQTKAVTPKNVVFKSQQRKLTTQANFRLESKLSQDSRIFKTTTESVRSLQSPRVHYVYTKARNINTHTTLTTSKSSLTPSISRRNIASTQVDPLVTKQRSHSWLNRKSKMVTPLEVEVVHPHYVNESSVEIITDLMKYRSKSTAKPQAAIERKSSDLLLEVLPIVKTQANPSVPSIKVDTTPDTTTSTSKQFCPLRSTIQNIISSSITNKLQRADSAVRCVSMDRMIGLSTGKQKHPEYINWNIPTGMAELIEAKNLQLQEIKSAIPHQPTILLERKGHLPYEHHMQDVPKYSSKGDVRDTIKSDISPKNSGSFRKNENKVNNLEKGERTVPKHFMKQTTFPRSGVLQDGATQAIHNTSVRTYATLPPRMTEKTKGKVKAMNSKTSTNTWMSSKVAKPSRSNLIKERTAVLPSDRTKQLVKPKVTESVLLSQVTPTHEKRSKAKVGKLDTLKTHNSVTQGKKSKPTMLEIMDGNRSNVFLKGSSSRNDKPPDKPCSGKNINIYNVETQSGIVKPPSSVVHNFQIDKNTTISTVKPKPNNIRPSQNILTQYLSDEDKEKVRNVKAISSKLLLDNTKQMSLNKKKSLLDVKLQQKCKDNHVFGKNTNKLVVQPNSSVDFKPQVPINKLNSGTSTTKLAVKPKSSVNIKPQEPMNNLHSEGSTTILAIKTKSSVNVKEKERINKLNSGTSTTKLAVKTKSSVNVKPQEPMKKLNLGKSTTKLAVNTKSSVNVKPQEPMNKLNSGKSTTKLAVNTKSSVNVKPQESMNKLNSGKSTTKLAIKTKSSVNVKPQEPMNKLNSGTSTTKLAVKPKSSVNIKPQEPMNKLHSEKSTTKLAIKTKSSVNVKEKEPMKKLNSGTSTTKLAVKPKSSVNIKPQEPMNKLHSEKSTTKLAIKTKSSVNVKEKEPMNKLNSGTSTTKLAVKPKSSVNVKPQEPMNKLHSEKSTTKLEIKTKSSVGFKPQEPMNKLNSGTSTTKLAAKTKSSVSVKRQEPMDKLHSDKSKNNLAVKPKLSVHVKPQVSVNNLTSDNGTEIRTNKTKSWVNVKPHKEFKTNNVKEEDTNILAVKTKPSTNVKTQLEHIKKLSLYKTANTSDVKTKPLANVIPQENIKSSLEKSAKIIMDTIKSIRNDTSPQVSLSKQPLSIDTKKSNGNIKSSGAIIAKVAAKIKSKGRVTKLVRAEKPKQDGKQTILGDGVEVKTATLAQGTRVRPQINKKKADENARNKTSESNILKDSEKTLNNTDKDENIGILKKKIPLLPKLESLASEFYCKAKEIKSKIHTPNTEQIKSKPNLPTNAERKKLDYSMFPQLQSVVDTRKMQVLPQIKTDQAISKIEKETGTEGLKLNGKEAAINVSSPVLENEPVDITSDPIKPKLKTSERKIEPEITISASELSCNADASTPKEHDLLCLQLSTIETNSDIKDTELDSSSQSKDATSKIHENDTPLPKLQPLQKIKTSPRADSDANKLKGSNAKHTFSASNETHSIFKPPRRICNKKGPSLDIKANNSSKISRQIEEKQYGLQKQRELKKCEDLKTKISKTRQRQVVSCKGSQDKINNLISAAAYKPWRKNYGVDTMKESNKLPSHAMKNEAEGNKQNADTATNVICLPPPQKNVSVMNSTGKPLYRVNKPIARYYSDWATNLNFLENRTTWSDTIHNSDDLSLKELFMPTKKCKPPSFFSDCIDDDQRSPLFFDCTKFSKNKCISEQSTTVNLDKSTFNGQYWRPPKKSKPPPKICLLPPKETKLQPSLRNSNLCSSKPIRNSNLNQIHKLPFNPPTQLHKDVMSNVKIAGNLKKTVPKLSHQNEMNKKMSAFMLKNATTPRSTNSKHLTKPKASLHKKVNRNKRLPLNQVSINIESKSVTPRTPQRKQLRASDYSSDGYTTAKRLTGSKLLALLPSMQSRFSHCTSSKQRPAPNSMHTIPVKKYNMKKCSRVQIQHSKQQSTNSISMNTPDFISQIYCLKSCSSLKKGFNTPPRSAKNVGAKPSYFHSKTRYCYISEENKPCEDEVNSCDTARAMRKVVRRPHNKNSCRMKKVCTVWPKDYCQPRFPHPEPEIKRLKCVFTKKKPKSCALMKLPGCGPRLRLDCSKEMPDEVCIKILPPMPSFSECVRKMPSKPFPTECKISEKIKYLQPRHPFFVNQKEFKILPPNPGSKIDPSLAECCLISPASLKHCESGCSSSGKESAPSNMQHAPPNTAPPKTTPPQIAPPQAPAPIPKLDSSGPGSCEELLTFLQAWFPFLKCQSPFPVPTMSWGGSNSACQFKPAPKLSSSCNTTAHTTTSPNTTSRATRNKTHKPTAGCSTAKQQKMPECLFNDKKMRFPGCKVGNVINCREPPEKPRVPCTKVEAPVPSFSECKKCPFPPIPVSECIVADQLKKIHTALRDHGKKITREAIEYMKCKAKKTDPDDAKPSCGSGSYSMSNRESKGIKLEGKGSSARRLYHQQIQDNMDKSTQIGYNSCSPSIENDLPTNANSQWDGISCENNVAVANMSRPFTDLVKSITRSISNSYENQVSDHNMDTKSVCRPWTVFTRDFTSGSYAQSLQQLDNVRSNKLDEDMTEEINSIPTVSNKTISAPSLQSSQVSAITDSDVLSVEVSNDDTLSNKTTSAPNLQPSLVSAITDSDVLSVEVSNGDTLALEHDLVPETINDIRLEDGDANKRVELGNECANEARIIFNQEHGLIPEGQKLESFNNVDSIKTNDHEHAKLPDDPVSMSGIPQYDLERLEDVYMATMYNSLKSFERLGIKNPENYMCIADDEASDTVKEEFETPLTGMKTNMDTAPNKKYSRLKIENKLLSRVLNAPDTTQSRSYSKQVSDSKSKPNRKTSSGGECEEEKEFDPRCKPRERDEPPCRKKTKEEIRCDYDPSQATALGPEVIPCPVPTEDMSCRAIPYKLAPGELEANDVAKPKKVCNKPKEFQPEKMCDVLKPKPRPETDCFSRKAKGGDDCVEEKKKPTKSTECKEVAKPCAENSGSMDDVKQKIATQLKKWFGCADDPKNLNDSSKKKTDDTEKKTADKKTDDHCKSEGQKVEKVAKKQDDPCKCDGQKEEKVAKKKADPCKSDGQKEEKVAKKKADPCKSDGQKEKKIAKKKEDPCKGLSVPKKKKDEQVAKKKDPCKKENTVKASEIDKDSSEDPCKVLEEYAKKKRMEAEKNQKCETEKEKNTCKKMKFHCPNFEPLKPPRKGLGNPPCGEEVKECANEKPKEAEIGKDHCKAFWEERQEAMKGLSLKEQIEQEMKKYHSHCSSIHKNKENKS